MVSPTPSVPSTPAEGKVGTKSIPDPTQQQNLIEDDGSDNNDDDSEDIQSNVENDDPPTRTTSTPSHRTKKSPTNRKKVGKNENGDEKVHVVNKARSGQKKKKDSDYSFHAVTRSRPDASFTTRTRSAYNQNQQQQVEPQPSPLGQNIQLDNDNNTNAGENDGDDVLLLFADQFPNQYPQQTLSHITQPQPQFIPATTGPNVCPNQVYQPLLFLRQHQFQSPGPNSPPFFHLHLNNNINTSNHVQIEPMLTTNATAHDYPYQPIIPGQQQQQQSPQSSSMRLLPNHLVPPSAARPTQLLGVGIGSVSRQSSVSPSSTTNGIASITNNNNPGLINKGTKRPLSSTPDESMPTYPSHFTNQRGYNAYNNTTTTVGLNLNLHQPQVVLGQHFPLSLSPPQQQQLHLPQPPFVNNRDIQTLLDAEQRYRTRKQDITVIPSSSASSSNTSTSSTTTTIGAHSSPTPQTQSRINSAHISPSNVISNSLPKPLPPIFLQQTFSDVSSSKPISIGPITSINPNQGMSTTSLQRSLYNNNLTHPTQQQQQQQQQLYVQSYPQQTHLQQFQPLPQQPYQQLQQLHQQHNPFRALPFTALAPSSTSPSSSSLILKQTHPIQPRQQSSPNQLITSLIQPNSFLRKNTYIHTNYHNGQNQPQPQPF